MIASTLAEAIKLLAPDGDPLMDYLVIDRLDGRGATLGKWDTAKLGPRPTEAKIVQAKTAAAIKLGADRAAVAAKAAELIALKAKLTSGQNLNAEELRALLLQILGISKPQVSKTQ